MATSLVKSGRARPIGAKDRAVNFPGVLALKQSLAVSAASNLRCASSPTPERGPKHLNGCLDLPGRHGTRGPVIPPKRQVEGPEFKLHRFNKLLPITLCAPMLRLLENLEEIPTLLVLEGTEPPIVKQQDIYPGELAEEAAVGAVGAR